MLEGDLLTKIIAEGDAVLRCLMPEDAAKVERWRDAHVLRTKAEQRFKLSEIDPQFLFMMVVMGMVVFCLIMAGIFGDSRTDRPRVNWQEVWACDGSRVDGQTAYCSTELVKTYEARISGYTCTAPAPKPTAMLCVWAPL